MRKARRRSTAARANGSRDKQIVKTTEASWKQYSGHQSLLAFCWISHKLWESRRRTKCLLADRSQDLMHRHQRQSRQMARPDLVVTQDSLLRDTMGFVPPTSSAKRQRSQNHARGLHQKEKEKKTMTEINSDRKRNDHGCRIYTKRRSASPIWMFMCGAIKYKTKGLVQCNE